MAEFITSSIVAKILGITQRTAINWGSKGHLPGAHKVGGVWLFNEQKIRNFMKAERRGKPWQSTNGAKSITLSSHLKGSPSDAALRQRLGLKH